MRRVTNPRIIRIFKRRAAAAGLTLEAWYRRNEAQAERERLPTRAEAKLVLMAHAQQNGRLWL